MELCTMYFGVYYVGDDVCGLWWQMTEVLNVSTHFLLKIQTFIHQKQIKQRLNC